MMMGGMAGGMFWGAILVVLLLLGFAYIIWVLASKESGGVKITGQVIAVIIAVLAILILLYGGVYGGMMGRGFCGGAGRMGRWGGGMGMGPGMTHYMQMMPEEERHEMMEQMMKYPEVQEWMKKYAK